MRTATVWVVLVVSVAIAGCDEGGVTTCTLDSGCGSGEYCTLDMSPADMLAGRIVYHCLPRSGVGEDCELPSDLDINSCVDGSFCGHAAGAATWSCRPAVATGGECPSLGVGPFTCAGGGVCLSGASATATCQAGGGEGDACPLGAVYECQAGLFCGDADTCVRRLAAGGTCTPEAKYCAAEHTGITGCTFFSHECAAGLYCRMAPADQCASFMDCDMDTEQCCATAGGAQCRPDGESCDAPTGTCGP
jgi:hypothetical protein